MKRIVVIALLTAAILFVMLGIGAVVFFTVNGGFPANNPFDRRNISSTLEEKETLEVDAGKQVTLWVENAAGDVTVTGAEVETLQIRAVKTAYDSSQSRADQEVKGIEYTVEQQGNTVTIKYELPRSMNFNNRVNTVDFFLTVPTGTTVDVDGNFGDVSISDLTGDVGVGNGFGAVNIENMEGALSVATGSGSVTAVSVQAGRQDIDLRSDFGGVTLRHASGNRISLESSSGKIALEDVRATGDVRSLTSFGDITFENGAGRSLTVETNSGRVSLVKLTIRGEIKVQNDFGEIELEQALAASYDLVTNSGPVAVDGAKGALKAHTDFGGIRITNAQAVTLDLTTSSGAVTFSGSLGEGPHLVTSSFGEIDLTLPADVRLDVDLSTDFGTIRSDLPVTATLHGSTGTEGNQIVGSINGGGDPLTARTGSGSVTLHSGP